MAEPPRATPARSGSGVLDAAGRRDQPAHLRPTRGAGDSQPPIDWGPYTAAVRGWEAALGQTAPHPVEASRTGRPRLTAVFVEWLMGLPPGWVTDLDLPCGAQLHALGNGVVPQQAAHAVVLLLDDLARVLSSDADPAVAGHAA